LLELNFLALAFNAGLAGALGRKVFGVGTTPSGGSTKMGAILSHPLASGGAFRQLPGP